MKKFLKRLKKDWIAAIQVGIWIFGIIGGFVVAPKMGGPAEEQSVWKLAQFVVNISVILLFIAAGKYSLRQHLKGWVLVTIATLILGLVAYFSYLNQQGTCTCNYYSTKVLIGTEIRPEIASNVPCEELLKDHTGSVEEIWTKGSINRCRLILGVSYITTLPLFTTVLISALQALFLSRKRET